MKILRNLAATAMICAGFFAPACSTAVKERAAIDPAREAGPRPVNHESPHVEIKADRTNVLPGRSVLVKGYGRGDLKGGWRCLSQVWCDDETGCHTEGVPPGAQCGELGETWIWPEGPGRPYRFGPGEHAVCLAVYDHHGWIVGSKQCVRIDVAEPKG